MNALKDYVEWKLTHSDKTAEVEGYPLVLENCKINKRMKGLKVYGTADSVGEKTNNLYDAKTYPLDKNDICIWSMNGNIGMSTGFVSTSKYIPCTELQGKTITISGCSTSSTNPGIAFYDENQTYISGKGYSKQSYITCTVPDNASFYRFCVTSDYKETAMIVEGNNVVPYEPYDMYKIPIIQKGKNLLDFKNNYGWAGSGGSKPTFIENGVIATGNVNPNATSPYNASCGWVVFLDDEELPFTLGQPVTISFDITPLEKHDERWDTATGVYFISSANNSAMVNIPNLELGVKKHITCAFPSSNQAGWLGTTWRFWIYLCSHTMKIENIQVEYGDVATEYEPYVEPVIHNVFVDEPLSANDVLDIKEHTELPKLTAKTTVFTIDTTTPPSKMYGKYIKR